MSAPVVGPDEDVLPPPRPTGAPRPEATTRAFDAAHPPLRSLIDDCVHCGFCLPSCPTYVLWGEEMDSPRGRILLMDLAERGEIGLTAETVRHWDSCLGCMACETACPSNVQYGRLLEATRAQVERRFERTAADRAVRNGAFAVLPYHRRLRALATGPLVAFRATGAQRLLRRSPLYRHLPAAIRRLDALAPTLAARSLRAGPPARTAPDGSAPGGGPALRVVLLQGCVQRAFFGDVNAAAARVLAAAGCEVLAPSAQGCCGALELHAGRADDSRERARRLIAALDGLGADRYVTTSAGCGSALKGYGELLADDPAWALRASRFAAAIRDVHEVLDETGLPTDRLQPLPVRVAYHDACHLAHAQGVRQPPRDLLGAIPGLQLVELGEPAICCGSAGVYNLLEPAAAADLGRRKAATVRDVAPDALAAANPGCLIQIAAHLRGGTVVPCFHPLELLDASLAGRDAPTLLDAQRRLQASAG